MPPHQNSQDIRAWWWNTVHILNEDEHLRAALQDLLLGERVTASLEHLASMAEKMEDIFQLSSEVLTSYREEIREMLEEQLQRQMDLLNIFRSLARTQDSTLSEQEKVHQTLMRLLDLQDRTLQVLLDIMDSQKRTSEHLRRLAEALRSMEERWERLLDAWQVALEGEQTPPLDEPHGDEEA